MPHPPDWMPAPAVPDRKVGAYLLDVNHAEGGPKAAFFLSRGFTVEDPKSFIMALLDHARPELFVREVIEKRVTKHVHEGPMPMPDGSSPRVRTVWKLVENDLMKLLVTAYAI